MIKAIETKYKGYRFRSRLEARWAVFFDALGVRWEYEKEGYDLGDAGSYLPDFWLPDFKTWIEVKPLDHQSNEVKEKLSRLLDQVNGSSEWRNDPFDLTFNAGLANENFHCELLSYTTLPATFDAARFSKANNHSIGHMDICCVVCGFEYVHLDEFTNSPGGRDRDRTGVELHFWCEQGCRYTIHISNYKGLGYADVLNATHKSNDFIDLLAPNQKLKIDAARTSARAARFEHGEEG